MCGWCHFSVAITLCKQKLLQNAKFFFFFFTYFLLHYVLQSKHSTHWPGILTTPRQNAWPITLSQRITSVRRSHPLSAMDMCAHFQGYTSNSCWGISACTRVMDQPTNTAIPRATSVPENHPLSSALDYLFIFLCPWKIISSPHYYAVPCSHFVIERLLVL